MLTLGTLFSGGGGVELGAEQLGVKPLWGIEINPKIANVAKDNGLNTLIGDVHTFDFNALPKVDILHASPPCQNFSQLNQSTEPNHTDWENAKAIMKAVDLIEPTYVTIENVASYDTSNEARELIGFLVLNGYNVKDQRVNGNKLGVPQRRLRYVIRASKHSMCDVPVVNHHGWQEPLDHLTFNAKDLTPVMKRKMGNMEVPDTCFVSLLYHTVCVFTPDKHFPTLTAKFAGKGRLRIDGEWYLPNKELFRYVQTFPESYKLPGIILATKILGNSVPPTMYKHILGTMI